MMTQIASTAGAIMILLGYFCLQTGRLKETAFSYLHLNFVGGSLLFYAAIVSGQIGFIVLEGAWVLLTIIGYFRRARSL